MLQRQYPAFLTSGGGALASPFRWLLTRALLAIAPRTSVRSFELASLTGAVSERATAQMEGAFDLIGAVAPQILARIHRDVKRIMLVDAGGPEFWPLARGFILNTAFVEGSDIEFIALTIVHEATHARLWHAGFRYHERLRGRIERICVGAERAFAMRLPDAEYFVAYSEEKLASPWWAASQVEARQARARAKLWPGWLFRARQRVVSWRRRSAAPPERCLGDSHDAL